MEFNDPHCVEDTYVHRLAKIEHLGGGDFRFTFVVDLDDEAVVRRRLVMNIEQVGPAICMAAKEIGMTMLPSGIARAVSH